MALLVQTPRGTVSLPPQGFFQQQPSPFASQLTPRGIPFVPSQSRAPRLIPTAIAPPIPAPAAPVFAPPPLLAPVRQHDDFGFDPDDLFSDPLTDDAAFGPGSETTITGTIGGLLGDVADFASDKVTVENPLPTLADYAFSFTPVVGPINAISGFFGGPTIGKSLFGEDGLFGGDGPAGGPGPGSTSSTGGGHSFGDPGDITGAAGGQAYDDTRSMMTTIGPAYHAYMSEPNPLNVTKNMDTFLGRAPSAPDDEATTTGGLSDSIGSAADNAANTGMEDEAEDADASDGDGDGSFICTAAWNTGISNSQTWSSDKRMFAYIVKNDPDAYAGYKKVGPWIAKRVHRGKLLWMARLFPRSWAYEIDQRQGKDTSKYPLWIKIENRLQRAFVRPLFRLWGRA
tara:strand:- start:173 stop:1369 length:1197 start_codon:yes stop_codon:yes gene_type:complete